MAVYAPPFSDLVIEAYARIQVRPTSFTQQHLQDALNSANLLLIEWTTKPNTPNLWQIQLLSTPLVQGTATYAVPPTVAAILDSYIRQYDIGNPVNLTNAFSTTIGSPSIAINQPQHGLLPGNWISINVPVAIAGLVLQGFYTVTSVIDVNNYTITASANATATVVAGGVVPTFTTTLGSSVVTVGLANHGLYPNADFTVAVLTLVAGLSLTGLYTVGTVIDANTFTISAAGEADGPATVSENGGATQIEAQLPNAAPLDRVQYPISRSDYSAQPNKFSQAQPNTFWFNRQINPTVTFWQVPDQNGPYVYFYYAMVQLDAVDYQGSPEVPWRFLEAFAAGLAARLAWKYPPDVRTGVTIQGLEAKAEQMWMAASQQDVEDVPWSIVPSLSSYFR